MTYSSSPTDWWDLSHGPCCFSHSPNPQPPSADIKAAHPMPGRPAPPQSACEISTALPQWNFMDRIRLPPGSASVISPAAESHTSGRPEPGGAAERERWCVALNIRRRRNTRVSFPALIRLFNKPRLWRSSQWCLLPGINLPFLTLLFIALG